jgi:hypothetical protein
MIEIEKALNYYRSAVEGRRPDFVPARVLLPEKVRSDVPILSQDGCGYYADAGEHDCHSNQYGAISVKAANGKMLGIKPGEFNVIAWRPNDKAAATSPRACQ